MREEPNIVHSDIVDPNYRNREEELEAKTSGVKLNLILRLAFMAVVVLTFIIAGLIAN